MQFITIIKSQYSVNHFLNNLSIIFFLLFAKSCEDAHRNKKHLESYNVFMYWPLVRELVLDTFVFNM